MRNEATLLNYSFQINQNVLKKVLKTTLLAILFSFSFLQLSAQVSVTATAGTLGPTSYTTVKLAFDAINAGTHQGVIVISINASTTEITTPCVLNSTGSGSAVYASVLIKPTAIVTISGATTTGRGLIELFGADNVTIDGAISGSTKDLTITNTAASSVTYTSAIRVAVFTGANISSADAITIKNCNLNGSGVSLNSSSFTSTSGSENTTFGIYCGGTGGTTQSATLSTISSVTTKTAVSGTTINTLLVDNNTINQCARAIVFNGAAASVAVGTTTITNNIIGGSGTQSGNPPFTTPATTVYTKGIWLNGLTTATITGNTVQNLMSYVGTTITGLEFVGAIGAGNHTITGNTFTNVVNNGSSAVVCALLGSGSGTFNFSSNTLTGIWSVSSSVMGISYANTATSSTIALNKITTIRSRTTGGQFARGISCSLGNAVTIQNNFISDVLNIGSTSFSNSFNADGILLSGGINHKVYHNSVNLFGVSTSVGSNSINCLAISASSQTGIDVRNNIFSNTVTGGAATDAHTCVFLPFTASVSMLLNLNNNAYYSGSGSVNGIAYINSTAFSAANLLTAANFNPGATTPATNLRNFTSACGVVTSDNASYASSTALAPFTSTIDLLLNTGSSETINNLWNKGATGTGVTTDIQGEARPQGIATNPTIGADEVLIVVCTMANGGSISPGTAIGCNGSTYTMSSIGSTTGAGITTQWEISATGGGVGFSDVTGGSGATTTSYTTDALTIGTYYYRLRVDCSNGPVTGYSNELTLTVYALPTVTVSPIADSYCSPGGTAVTLTAGGASTYTWNPTTGLSPTSGSPVDASPATTTVYTVTGTDGNGCTNTAMSTITVTNTPQNVTALATPNTICSGDISNLTSSAYVPTSTTVNNYIFSTTTGASLDPMSGAATVVGLGVDDAPMAPANSSTAGASLALPFTFNYNGAAQTFFSASPDGWLVLSNSAAAATSSFTNTTTLTTNTPKIFAYWDDSATGTDGWVKTVTTGVAPNRIFKVEWKVTIPRNTSGASNSTFQVWLYETTNIIELRYGAMGVAATSSSAGLSGGALFNSITFSTNTASNAVANDAQIGIPSSGRMYTFSSPSAALTYAWTPAIDVVNPTDQNTATNALLSTTNFTVTASNGGCTAQAIAMVMISAGAAITAEPVSDSKCEGQTATFTVEADGASPTYQWRKGGVDIPIGGNASAGTATLSLTNVMASDAAVYDVVVSSSCGSPVTSNGVSTLTVNPKPTASASNDGPKCVGSELNLTGSHSGGMGTTFTWTGPASYSASTQNAVRSPLLLTHSGTYTFTATSALGCTSEPATTTVTINTSPASISIAPPGPVVLCSISPAELLTASGGTLGGVATIGIGTVNPGTTSYPNPLSAYYGGTRHQMIYTTSELLDQGLSSGSIIDTTSLNLSEFIANACTKLTIRMKHTSASVLTGFDNSGLTIVRDSANFTPSTTGWVKFPLNTNFVWNGTDNILVEFTHNAGNTGNGSGTRTFASTTGTNMTYYGSSDDIANGIGGFWAESTFDVFGASTTRPNIRFNYSNPTNLTWSPIAGLYTNDIATIAYTGTPTNMVYAKPVATETYTVTASTETQFTFDGTINESGWGAALATSAGGPSPSFGAGQEINALYVQGGDKVINFGIAGDVQNGNRILLFIDSKTGGYTNGSFGRTGAPQGIDDFNSGTTFDAGFEADYCLVIGTNVPHDNFFFDLYTLSAGGGPAVYLGDISDPKIGADPLTASNTRGFEIAITKALLGYTSGNIKVFAAYTADDGTLSNQFLTRAGSGDGTYGNGMVTFGTAMPDPITVPLTNLQSYCTSTKMVTVGIEGTVVKNSGDSGLHSLRSVYGCIADSDIEPLTPAITYDQEAMPTPTSTSILTSPLNITKSVTIKGLSDSARPIITVPPSGLVISTAKTLTLDNVDISSTGEPFDISDGALIIKADSKTVVKKID